MEGLNHSSAKSATTVQLAAGIVSTVVEYKDRLEEAMRAAGVSTSRLARELGISYQAVKKVLDGGSAAFNTENNAAAARVLGVNSDWLTTGKGQRVAPPPVADQPVFEIKSRNPGVPVIGTAELGDDGNFCELEDPVGHGDGRIDWPSRDQNAYALRCKGDSMKPRIRHGEYVVVEPNRDVVPGDEVLVKSKDGRVMVKQLAYIRDGMVYLDSVNEGHPRLNFPHEQLDAIHYVAGIAKSAMWSE